VTDFGIDLSFGPETVKPDEYEPLDEGIYSMYCSNVEVTQTKSGESMIVLEWTVTGPTRNGAKIKNDNLVVPGPQRKAQDPDKWNMMMNMLRNRLEKITGKDWRDDNMKLNPRQDLGGQNIKAIVVQKPYDYVKDGERKTGTGNQIDKYLRPDDNSTTYTPPMQQPGFSQPQQETSSQSAGTPGGFAI
jgi:hypothetical protein